MSITETWFAGPSAEWAKFLVGAGAITTCLNLGGDFVFHGPLGIWQVAGVVTALSIPVALVGRHLVRKVDATGPEMSPVWKARFENSVEVLIDAATLAVLLIALLLAGAKLMGTTHENVPAMVVSISDSGVRNKSCNVYATLRILSREPKVCIENMPDASELAGGQILNARVNVVPYGFLIDSLEAEI